jgi:hypothetical protein
VSSCNPFRATLLRWWWWCTPHVVSCLHAVRGVSLCAQHAHATALHACSICQGSCKHQLVSALSVQRRCCPRIRGVCYTIVGHTDASAPERCGTRKACKDTQRGCPLVVIVWYSVSQTPRTRAVIGFSICRTVRKHKRSAEAFMLRRAVRKTRTQLTQQNLQTRGSSSVPAAKGH